LHPFRATTWVSWAFPSWQNVFCRQCYLWSCLWGSSFRYCDDNASSDQWIRYDMLRWPFLSLSAYSEKKITIVWQTKRCYNGIATATKGCLLLADIVLMIDLWKPSFIHFDFSVMLLIKISSLSISCVVLCVTYDVLCNTRNYLLQFVIFFYSSNFIYSLELSARRIIIFFIQYYPIKRIA